MQNEDLKTSGGVNYSVALKLETEVTGKNEVPAQEDSHNFIQGRRGHGAR